MNQLIFKFKQWYAENAQTREQRLSIAGTVLATVVILAIVSPILIIGWRLFLALFILLLIFVVITSPLWIWILRGKK